jgi:hypothetical protein
VRVGRVVGRRVNDQVHWELFHGFLK